jgi:glycosyltransferase involved in cell wall biosynthesis
MIRVYTFYSGDGGWSRHAQSFLEALSAFEDVSLIPWDGPLKVETLSATSQQMLRNAESALHSRASLGIGSIELMRRMEGNYRIGFAVWETSIIPSREIEILCDLDEVWTPSEWGRALLVQNGVPGHKISVVPEGVDTELFRPGCRKPEAGRPFRFLAVGKWEDRKGIDDLVRAFAAEFQPGEAVELVLHCFNRYLPHLDQEARVRQLVSGPHAPIDISPPCSLAELAELYAASDAFVLPFRAEGWGLPTMEAMACGLPVIVTDYSAPRDYINSENAYPIRVDRMADVFDGYFFPSGAQLGQWAQPDLVHLRELMRHVFAHREEAAAKGRIARREVCARWTWNHAAAIAHRRLDERSFGESQVPEIALHQKRLDHALQNAAPYPEGLWEGRGIVICGGGEIHFPCAWVCISMLRKLGCELPVELWHRGPREMTDEMRSLVAPLGVTCVDAYEVARRHPVRRLDGWELKPYAIAFSRFEEVLYLDADNMAVVNPEFLFQEEPYRQNGVIFWQDRYSGPGTAQEWLAREAWEICRVPYRVEPELEAGQMLIHKRRSWVPLQLTLHLNGFSDFYYRYFYGDKDTFHLAWRRAGADYALAPHPPGNLGDSAVIVQRGFDGEVLFQHRNRDKWSLSRSNCRIPGFRLERECLEALEELRRRWAPGSGLPGLLSDQERDYYDRIQRQRFFVYEMDGAPRRTLELRDDFTIGSGATAVENRWMIEDDKDGCPLLSLRNENGASCFLRRSGGEAWRGRLLVYDRMAVELRPHR